MKFLILGHGRHGKDTVAEYLRDRHGIAFRSSSLFLAETVVRPALVAHGLVYDTLDACYEDRVNHRCLWRDIILAYNGNDKARLAKAILAVSDCYVGMRSIEEYRAARRLFDAVMWVDAAARGMPEDPSLTIGFEPDMILIDNNGSLDETYRQVDDWMRVLSWVRNA
ncbi:deoxynucleoside monophosphate kinase [Synechococcus phage Yong-M3-232]|nr:deoxynucleoside monophosphate kinase [Synechococcus phage Yong-M3-232]